MVCNVSFFSLTTIWWFALYNSFKRFHDECHHVIFLTCIILKATELFRSVSLCFVFFFKSNLETFQPLFFKYFTAPLTLGFGVFEFTFIWPFEVVRELNDDLTFYPIFLSVSLLYLPLPISQILFFFHKVYLRSFQFKHCSFISRKSFWIFLRLFNMSLLNVFNISSNILSIWNSYTNFFSILVC